MKSLFTPAVLATATLVTLIAFNAAADNTTIRNLPGKGDVAITGTVQNVKSEREFTLRDDSGKINVSIESNQSAVISKGDEVTVTGKIERGMMGKYIAASEVEVHKSLAAAVSDAIEGNTSISLDDAKQTKIGRLPKEGLVKIAGTVEDISDEKSFTLRDATGKVDVSIVSDENVVLTKDAAVTVIGYVSDGLLGKSIDAKHVIITADAGSLKPAAGSSEKKSPQKQ